MLGTITIDLADEVAVTTLDQAPIIVELIDDGGVAVALDRAPIIVELAEQDPVTVTAEPVGAAGPPGGAGPAGPDGPSGPPGPPGGSQYDDLPDITLVFDNMLI